ncbi:MAG: hypothetical protein ABSD98_01860 [Candidatus Korobacteraceae bacterium]|jgi:hypothetical protein
MIELHGVTAINSRSLGRLKRLTLLFDTIYSVPAPPDASPPESYLVADLDYLKNKGFVKDVPTEKVAHAISTIAPTLSVVTGSAELVEALAKGLLHWPLGALISTGGQMLMKPVTRQLTEDLTIRSLASIYHRDLDADVVPICNSFLSRFTPAGQQRSSAIQPVLQIAIEEFPMPSEDCSWEDILDFKAEQYDKEWGLRRFLKSLSTRHLTEAEVRDEIEWSLKEYTDAMKLRDMKSSSSFLDVFIIAPLETIENLVKFNWSKIAKGALSVKKRQIELLEAEANAPGRECAYVFEAKKKFGQ